MYKYFTLISKVINADVTFCALSSSSSFYLFRTAPETCKCLCQTGHQGMKHLQAPRN